MRVRMTRFRGSVNPPVTTSSNCTPAAQGKLSITASEDDILTDTATESLIFPLSLKLHFQ